LCSGMVVLRLLVVDVAVQAHAPTAASTSAMRVDRLTDGCICRQSYAPACFQPVMIRDVYHHSP
jgi:hypothetical protein